MEKPGRGVEDGNVTLNGDSSDNNKPSKQWVKFSEEDESRKDENGTNDPLSISHKNGPRNDETGGKSSKSPAAVIETSVEVVAQSPTRFVQPNKNSSGLQDVELRQSQNSQTNLNNPSTANGGRRNTGFTNGDVIVSVLPTNTRFPWVTPSSFRPELVPEELMVSGLTLTVEEYVHAMELLVSDFRFNAYTICYKRLLASWLICAFVILLIILFSGAVGISLFALGISWLIINAGAVFLCMFLKIKINQGLERCMSRVNKLLLKHKLIVGLDDRGRISCHKVHLCFIYFDPSECIKKLDQLLDGSEDRQRVQRHLDSTDVEIVITGSQQTTRIPQRQSEALFLKYIQRWIKDYSREYCFLEGVASLHVARQICPCQYIEEALKEKKLRVGGACCNVCELMAKHTPTETI